MLRNLKIIVLATMTFFLVLALPNVQAHDFRGLFAEKQLPADVRKEIERRDKIRYSRNTNFDENEMELPRRKNNSPVTDHQSARLESIEAVINAKTLWRTGTKITFCFFDGSRDAQREVMKIAKEIYDETTLKLDMNVYKCPKADAQIRVSFREKSGYRSLIGTDSLELKDTSKATMGLEDLDLELPFDNDVKGIIRHEIMHSAGALHEHQHSRAHCEEQLNWDVVARDLNLTPEQMTDNFKQFLINKDIQESTLVDKKSIMFYHLPVCYWKAGTSSDCFLPYSNNELSIMDKQMLREQYLKKRTAEK